MTVFYNSWLSGEFQLPILSGLGYALGMLNVVLVNPEIPHNTGAAGRLCLATGARLHLIKPLGFSIDDRQVKRAGLDYWKDVDLCLWDDWEAFIASIELDANLCCSSMLSSASPSRCRKIRHVV